MLKDMPKMVDVLPQGALGVAKITHYTVTELDSKMSAFRPGMYCPEGNYAILRVNGSMMMSDTRMERVSNYSVIERASGDVMIAGLGIGMILIPILKNPKVSSVTVIEKYADVASLVRPSIESYVGKDAKKLTIHIEDIYLWRPAKKGKQFDTIYFDIWPNVPDDDDWEDMKLLKKAFRPSLRKGGWMKCWKEDEI